MYFRNSAFTDGWIEWSLRRAIEMCGLYRGRRTNETAGCSRVARPTAAPNGSSKTPATTRPAEYTPAQSSDGPSPHTVSRTPRSATAAPGPSASAPLATDDLQEHALPVTHS